MAMTRDTPPTYELGDIHNRPVAATAKIYQGSVVGVTTAGFARPCQAGDAFGGFAEDLADNTGGADGAITVEAKARGRIVLTVAGVTVADVFKTVYASADDTFTLTATGNTPIGIIVRVDVPGEAVVSFDVAQPLT